MRIRTVATPNLLQDQTCKLFNRALETDPLSQSLTEQEITQLLTSRCIDLRTKIRTRDFNKAGYLSRKFVAEGKPVGLVEVFSDRATDKKIAYVGGSNWGSGVLLPANSGIDIFSDGAGSCPLLLMNLLDSKNKPYIFLAHVYCTGIDDQVNNIVEKLKDRAMVPVGIIFAPSLSSNFSTAKDVLENFIGGNLIFINRENTASGVATANGWSIVSDSDKCYKSELWKFKEGSNNFELLEQEFLIAKPTFVPIFSISTYVSALAISHDGTKAAIVCSNSEIMLFNPKDRSLIKKFNSYSSSIESISFNCDDSKIVTCGGGSQIAKVWDLKTFKESQYVFSQNPIISAAFNTDGRSILLVDNRGNVSLHYPIDL